MTKRLYLFAPINLKELIMEDFYIPLLVAISLGIVAFFVSFWILKKIGNRDREDR